MLAYWTKGQPNVEGQMLGTGARGEWTSQRGWVEPCGAPPLIEVPPGPGQLSGTETTRLLWA